MSILHAEIRLRLSPAFRLDCKFEAAKGFTVLFGHSGAGKTSVLDCIAGIRTPDEGKISLNGTAVFDSRFHVNRSPQNRRIAYVFQDLALFPHMTVLENVSFGLAEKDKSDATAQPREIISQFGINHLSSQRPKDLSGGERQRVALARSLITSPQALLLDEPLAALDRPTRTKIVEDLRRWNEEHKVPILYVTHSVREALSLGERVLMMQAGRIVGDGTPSDLLDPNEWD